MLKREMQIAQAIMHPNLITVLDGKLDCELPYTVQPLLVGSTLRALIDMGAKMSLPFALWIGRQIAEAIQVLHHAGLIHSDISPRNALVDAQGHVTLIDLGMARLVTQTEPTQIIAGTEEYIAPELKEDQGQFCKAIDIFSLGVVLSELVSGQVPKRTELKIAGITIKTDTVSNISSKHETSGGVKKLLSNMVEPKAKNRPTIDEVVNDLVALEVQHFADRKAA